MSGHHTRPSTHRADLSHEGRRPQATPPRNKDSRVDAAKAAHALVCSECKLVHHAGRWYRGAPPVTEVENSLCPACKRIRDGEPAGTIHVPEQFLERREELIAILRNAETAESEEHPLERLMQLEDDPGGGMLVTTTGKHLARAIANKLERRFHKAARLRYGDAEGTVSVDWNG